MEHGTWPSIKPNCSSKQQPASFPLPRIRVSLMRLARLTSEWIGSTLLYLFLMIWTCISSRLFVVVALKRTVVWKVVTEPHQPGYVRNVNWLLNCEAEFLLSCRGNLVSVGSAALAVVAKCVVPWNNSTGWTSTATVDVSNVGLGCISFGSARVTRFQE